MNESLEIKANARLQVELMVAIELAKFGKEIIDAVQKGLHGESYNPPEEKQLARKIIAIVKEHSL